MENDLKSDPASLTKKAEKLLKRKLKSEVLPLHVVDTLGLIHELEVLKIELEMQNDELERRKVDLEIENAISDRATDECVNLYDFAPLGYFALNKEGEIVDINVYVAKLLGKEQKLLQKSRFGFFVTDDSRPVFNRFFEEVFTTRLKATCEVAITSQDNNISYIHLTGVHSGSEELCLISAIDITELRQTEISKEMKREILQILNEPGDIKDLIHRTLTILKNQVGFDAVGIRLQEDNDFPYFDQIGFPSGFLNMENTLLEQDKNGNIYLACNCGNVLSGTAVSNHSFTTPLGSWWTNQLNSVSSTPSHIEKSLHSRNQCALQGYASMALVPIRNNSSIIGLMQFNDTRKDRFDNKKIELLEEIASLIGNALIRKSIEETLRKNEEALRTITGNAPDIILQLDRQGNILYINRPLPGYTLEECLGANFSEWTLSEYHDVMNQSLELVFQESTPQTYHSQVKHANGEIRWYRSGISPVREGGIVSSAIMSTRDVTESLLSEKELRESEERRSSIMVTAMDGFWLTDSHGSILEVNDPYCRMSGYSREELLTMHIQDIEVVENADNMRMRMRRILEFGEARFEIFHRRKDGSIMAVESNVHYRSINGGQFVSFMHDITERKQAEKELRESNERYKSLFHDNHSVMVLLNPDTGEIVDANPAACHYYGWSYSELTRKNIYEIDPFPKEETFQKLQSSKNEKNNHLFVQHLLASGELRDVEVYSGTIRFGESTMLYNIIHDITESKKAQEALLANEERYSLIYNSSRDGIFSVDMQGYFSSVNRSFCEGLELDPDQIIDHNFVEIGLQDNLIDELINLKKQVVSTNSSVISEIKIPFQDGSIYYYEIVLNPLHDDSGNVVGIGGSSRDITKRKKADEALKESEKRFRYLVKDMPVGVVLYGPSSEVVMSNPKALELLGVADEDQLGVDSLYSEGWKAVHEDGSVFYNSEYPVKQVFETLTSVHDVVVGINRTDSTDTTWLLMDAEVLLKKEGTVKNVVCSFIDITKLKMTEKELRENEQRLKYHFENSPLAVVEWDIDLIITEWSLEAEHIFGWTKEETIGKPIDTLNLIYNEDIPFIYHIMDRLTSGKEDTVVSYSRNLTKSGAIIDCTWYNSILQNQDGQMPSVMSLVQDITTRKQAEDTLKKLNEELEDRVKERTVELLKLNEGLKQAEEKYRTVSDFASSWEFWIDPVDHMIYCSPSSEQITGYTSTEFEQNSDLIFNIIHPDDVKRFLEHKNEEMKASASDHEIQYRIFKKDGTIRWMGHYCRPIYNATGEFMGIRGSNKDITARKKMEELLSTSNKKYQLLSENITDGIFICKKGRFEYANNAMYEIFGYEGHELHKMKLTQLVVSDYNEELEKILYSTEKVNRSCNIEIECLKKDFTIIFVEILLNYVAKDKTVYGVIHDITEKKEFQKNMVKAIVQTEEKERAHFSKELHDGLGPLLSTIKLYLQYSERISNKQNRQEIIGKAEEIIEEALSTVKEISYRLSPHLLTNYGLSPAIKSFVDKLNATASYQIVFESNLVRRIDIEIETAFYRAVIECINNTVKYAQASQINIQLLDTGSEIQLQYQDDGIGFDLIETLAQHKGLGLFNLKNRLHTFGGKVDLFSEQGKGVDYLFTISI